MFECRPGEFVLAVVVHHISGDGSSMGPLARDVMTAYAARVRGEAPGWAPLPVQYADYALWQREVLGEEADPESVLARQVAYWREALAELPEQLDLPADRPRPAVQSLRGRRWRSVSRRGCMRGWSGWRGSTMRRCSWWCMPALAVVLGPVGQHRGRGDRHAVRGSRGEAELDDLVGMFVNTLVLRTGSVGLPRFAELLAQVREYGFGGVRESDVPFERLVEVLNPGRSTAHHPLFQVSLALQNNPLPRLEFPGLRVSPVPASTGTSRFDLFFTLTEQPATAAGPGPITAMVEYASDLFDEATVRGFAARFVRVLEAVCADPRVIVADIDILDTTERHDLLPVRGPVSEPSQSLAAILTEAVGVAGDAAAVVCAGRVVSYRELDAWSDRLARVLIERGTGPERFVAVALARSVESVLAVWAVTKTGAAFLPVDPDYPARRGLPTCSRIRRHAWASRCPPIRHSCPARWTGWCWTIRKWFARWHERSPGRCARRSDADRCGSRNPPI